MLRKGTTIEQNYNAIRWCQKYGIQAEASFIFGIPGETYEDALETIKLMKKLNPSIIKCFPFTPIPGTESEKITSKYGSFDPENTDKISENSVVFIPNTMTKDQVESLIPLAYRRFYMRPRYVLRHLKNIKSFNDIKKAIRGFLAVKSL